MRVIHDGCGEARSYPDCDSNVVLARAGAAYRSALRCTCCVDGRSRAIVVARMPHLRGDRTFRELVGRYSARFMTPPRVIGPGLEPTSSRDAPCIVAPEPLYRPCSYFQPAPIRSLRASRVRPRRLFRRVDGSHHSVQRCGRFYVGR